MVELVGAAEHFYAERGAPARFQVTTASSPLGLARLLEARGYAASARTLVLSAAVATVADRCSPGDGSVLVADRADDAWFATYWHAEADRGTPEAATVCRRALLEPASPTAFVSLLDDDETRSVGQLVVQGTWAAVQCMTTTPAGRRRGGARTVLHHLARSAAAAGASWLYLAVMAENAPARALYRGAGFVASHEYCFFSRS